MPNPIDMFFDIKNNEFSTADLGSVKRFIFIRKSGAPRYGLHGTVQGRRLTKFISKGVWDELDYPIEKTNEKRRM